MPKAPALQLHRSTHRRFQELVDGWQAGNQEASTIRNSIKPLQAIYRRVRSREGLPVNPTHDLELPAPRLAKDPDLAPTPLPGLLRDSLIEHRLNVSDQADDALVFGVGSTPFQAAVIYRRADRAWREQSLGRLRLRQARHSYASFMIAAGVNAKALSAFMGHSSIKVTFDLYGHLMPGTEAEAAALLDSYLQVRVNSGAHVSQSAVHS